MNEIIISDKREYAERHGPSLLHSEGRDFDSVLEVFAEEKIYKPHFSLLKSMIGREGAKRIAATIPYLQRLRNAGMCGERKFRIHLASL